MKETAAKGGGDEELSFVKKSGYPQNRLLPPADLPFALQDEKTSRNMEKEKNQCLVITLPDCLAGFPVRVEADPDSPGIALNIVPQEDGNRKYLFVWNQSDFRKVVQEDVLWIEASGSYSIIRLRGGRTLTVSFNLSTVGRSLPADDFVRIHRSCIVNLKNVASLSGNSVSVDGRYLTIGREYRKAFFARFVFLGVRKDRKRE